MWVRKPYTSDLPITSPFGERIHPISGEKSFHKGIDVSMEVGTYLYAPFSGRISRHINAGGINEGYGLYAILEGATEQNTRVRLILAHLSEVICEGRVIKGGIIAKSGNSGSSTAPHLHLQLELYRDGSWIPVDPVNSIDFGNSVSWCSCE